MKKYTIAAATALSLFTMTPNAQAFEPIDECKVTSGSTPRTETECFLGTATEIRFKVSANCKNTCTGGTWQSNSPYVTSTGSCSCGTSMTAVGQTAPSPPWGTEFFSKANNREFSVQLGGCQTTGFVKASVTCSCPGCGNPSPILISLRDRRYLLTDAANGVLFDLDGDGVAEQTAWTAGRADDGFLVLDRNLNGHIDDYMEVFGDHTPQLPSDEPNGWLALAVWDDLLNGGNEDGIIDVNDYIFTSLQIWVDRNHNGFSEPHELSSLEEAGVVYLDLDYGDVTRIDQHGNAFKFPSIVGRADGEITIAWDVFFAQL